MKTGFKICYCKLQTQEIVSQVDFNVALLMASFYSNCCWLQCATYLGFVFATGHKETSICLSTCVLGLNRGNYGHVI